MPREGGDPQRGPGGRLGQVDGALIVRGQVASAELVAYATRLDAMSRGEERCAFASLHHEPAPTSVQDVLRQAYKPTAVD